MWQTMEASRKRTELTVSCPQTCKRYLTMLGMETTQRLLTSTIALGYGGGRCLLQILYLPFRANCQTSPTGLPLVFTPTGHCVLVIWQTQQLGNQNMSSTSLSPLGCSATSFFCTNCWLQEVSSPGGTPHKPRQLSELKQGGALLWGLVFTKKYSRE